MILNKGAIPHENGCVFRVWAPHAENVFILGSFNDWSKEANSLEREKDGWWKTNIQGAVPGDEYQYRIVSGTKELFRIDPYSRNVTSSVGNSIITRPSDVREVSDFSSPLLNETIIYELHIGTFGKTSSDKPSNLESAVKRLPYLKELGVNALEIMPVGEFAGAYSWGYNPSHIFAVESDYGNPNSFRNFVKTAHEHGIAVILDVIYNHLGPTDLNLWQFDGWSENNKGGIYFYNDQRANTPWGETRPDYGRAEVREFLRDNALFWLEEYGVDGLRWDATSFIRNVNGGSDPAGDIPDGWNLMQWINDEIKKVKPGSFTIAEDMQDNPYLTKASKDGGAGFDAQWDARFVHAVRGALIFPDDAARDLDAVRDAIMHRYYLNGFERVIYTESHDEIANGKARVPEEVQPGHASNWFAKKKACLGAALVFLSPGIPMIFQGQEFLEDDWFHDKDPLDWSKKERFAGILQLFKDLIRLRLNCENVSRGLCGQDVNVHHVNQKEKVLAFHRWDKGGPGDTVVAVMNFANKLHENYEVGLPHDGIWKIRLNSDSSLYDASFGNVACEDIQAVKLSFDGLPYKGKFSFAPYSFLILSADS